jgi:hypothetical protein
MPSQKFLTLLLVFGALSALLTASRRRVISRRRSHREERSLWVSLAAGLFDAESSPAADRLEVALAAIARKLGLRGAIVTAHGRDHCRVLAASAADPSLLPGLERGAVLARATLYCGTLRCRGQSLAIDYAGVSEWRSHRAFRERGWQSYVAVNCGLEGGEDVVVAFFDTSPRGTVFSRSERALVEQLAPWVATMVSGPDDRRAETDVALPVAEAPRA